MLRAPDALAFLKAEALRTAGKADFDQAITNATGAVLDAIVADLQEIAAHPALSAPLLGIGKAAEALAAAASAAVQPAVTDNTGSNASPGATGAIPPPAGAAASPSAAEGVAAFAKA